MFAGSNRYGFTSELLNLLIEKQVALGCIIVGLLNEKKKIGFRRVLEELSYSVEDEMNKKA